MILMLDTTGIERTLIERKTVGEESCVLTVECWGARVRMLVFGKLEEEDVGGRCQWGLGAIFKRRSCKEITWSCHSLMH